MQLCYTSVPLYYKHRYGNSAGGRCGTSYRADHELDTRRHRFDFFPIGTVIGALQIVYLTRADTREYFK